MCRCENCGPEIGKDLLKITQRDLMGKLGQNSGLQIPQALISFSPIEKYKRRNRKERKMPKQKGLLNKKSTGRQKRDRNKLRQRDERGGERERKG